MDKVHLEELFTIGSSKRVFQSDWRNRGIPFYRAREIAKLAVEGSVDNELFIDEELYQEYIEKYGKPEPGDIMVTGVGTLGVCYIVKENDEFYFKDGNILWFRQKAKNKVLSEYVVKAFNSRAIKEQILRNSSGTTVGTFTIQTAKQIELEFPCLEEQSKIVTILSRLENIIDMRKTQLDSLDNLIKSRFVEMFGHQSHNEKGLPYGRIEDVAEIYLGITHTPTYVDSGVIFISAKNTSSDYLDLSDVKYISRKEFEGAPQGSKPKQNDVLFSRVGSNLGHPVILEENLELCTFVSLGYLRTKGSLTSNYLKHWMRDEFFAKQVEEHVRGGGQPNLNTGWLKEFKIIIPSIDTQYEFDEFCNQVDKLKFEAQKSLNEMQKLFDSLMQKYFG